MRLQGFRSLIAASLLLMAGWSSLVGTQTVEAAPWLVGGGTSATGFIGGTNGDFTTFDFTSATLSVDTVFGVGFYGFLNDGTTSYQSEFALFLNPDGSFGDAAWAMYAVAPQSVPEPSTLVIFGAGVLGMGWQVRRRQRLQAAC
ncbi:MAG: PEP-CTERM sorting domain-containing protein [Planctomycetota bacterium]